MHLLCLVLMRHQVNRSIQAFYQMKSPVSICLKSLERELEVRWMERGRRGATALSQTSGLAWEVGTESTRWNPLPEVQPLTTSLFLCLSFTHTWTHFYTLHGKDKLCWFTVQPVRSSGFACHFGMMAAALGPHVQWILMVLYPSQPCCRGVLNMHASCGKRQTLQWSRKCVCFLYSEDSVRKCPETVSIKCGLSRDKTIETSNILL